MNFQNIDYFLQVARKRSFSQAAEELFITQQTLSAVSEICQKLSAEPGTDAPKLCRDRGRDPRTASHRGGRQPWTFTDAESHPRFS